MPLPTTPSEPAGPHATGGLSRRRLLATGIPLAGLATLGAGKSASAALTETPLPSSPFRIDVHCHHIPDFYRTSMAEHGIVAVAGMPIAPWEPHSATAFMDSYGIQAQVVSISDPGVDYLPTAAERLAMAQRINEYTSNDLIHTRDPLLAKRFGGFGVLPLGDPSDPDDINNSCAEARRILLDLDMDGVGMYSNYHGTYLGNPSLEPLMATLNALEAFVFLHPVTPSSYPDLGLPAFLYEFVFDTTRAVVNMLYRGIFDRYPRIRWLIAHAGGTAPFIAYRTSLLTLYPAIAQNLGIAGVNDQNADYAKLFYDTALSPAPSAMRSVREVSDLSHIMFATDWPFSAPLFLVPGDPAPQLSQTFTTAQRLEVLNGRCNALAQLPRLAARLEGAG
jgi:predicted TIM-barrel fold metal-dependent hydrolase